MHRLIDYLPNPDQRLHEVARILTGGVLRLRKSFALPASPTQLPGPQILLEYGPNSLEVLRDTRLSVHSGLRILRPR